MNADDFQFETGDRGREHLILRVDVGGADETAQTDELCLLIERDLAHGLDDQHAVGKDVFDLSAEGGGEA